MTPVSGAPAAALFLPEVEANPEPGVYRTLIEAATQRGAEHAKIWELFAFRQDVTMHLARFTQGVLRQPASISPGLRELVAAFTSFQNDCRFCTNAHAAAAGELLGDHDLVWRALRDLDHAELPEREKALLRFTARVTRDLPSVGADDIATLRGHGWDDEAIYFTVTTCALFNFYNRWISATGVPAMSEESHRAQGRQLAERGYARD